ncbi:MAG TPA: response regulator transcription factor [Desulfomonilia bacterium]|jgi:DNA-binding response OmpR family regulator|nr:response regulator transcription factor [Thermodesulfobacteriota bacterium]HWR68974.1 response regulator transcription factor [Desulfomonilia bacterium]
MRILLVEDDIRTADIIRKMLSQGGYTVEHAKDGEEGLIMALNETFDAAVFDVMLPKLDGFQLIERIRKNGISLPVIFLSARSTVDDRIQGLQSGGDDYMVKPFALSELLTRIQALIRRATSVTEPTALTVGDLSMDLLSRRITRSGMRIDLQHLEFSLLEYLMRNAGRVVSKTMIIEHVWDYSFDPHTNVVEARICHLRDKIDRPFDNKLIHTIRGVGYILEERD